MLPKALERRKTSLMKRRRRLDIGAAGWRKNTPSCGGVYVIWRGTVAVYVGESANLYERFGDLERTVNHTFRRTLLKRNQRLSEPGLTRHIRENFKISHVALRIGRKELEEYLICHWDTTDFNKLPARYCRSESYQKNT